MTIQDSEQIRCEYCRKLISPGISIVADNKTSVKISLHSKALHTSRVIQQGRFDFCDIDCFCRWTLNQLLEEEK